MAVPTVTVFARPELFTHPFSHFTSYPLKAGRNLESADCYFEGMHYGLPFI